MFLDTIPLSFDVFALDNVDGENVIITLPDIIGPKDSEWEGSLIFRKNYLLKLIEHGLKHGVLEEGEIDALIESVR